MRKLVYRSLGQGCFWHLVPGQILHKYDGSNTTLTITAEQARPLHANHSDPVLRDERGAVMKTVIAAVLTALSIWGAAVALADNGSSSAPTPPPAPPTPVPIVATGGATTGTSPGSSCVPRLGLRTQPAPQSPVMLWNLNGDVGWPFGWPGPLPFAVPSTAPTVGCAR
jgi:hypothetical protein